MFVSLLLLLIMAVFIIVPIGLLMIDSFNVAKPGQGWEFGLNAYKAAFGSARTLMSIVYTGVIVLLRVVPAILCAVVIAYLLARTDLPWKSQIEFLFWIAFFLPTFPLALGWILLLDPNYGMLNNIIPFINLNIYSIGGIAWVHFTSTTLPIMVMLLTPAFRLFSPDFEEAAIVSGASRMQTMRRILFPLALPAAAAVFLISTIKGLESFEIELLLGVPAGIDVYSTRIYDYVSKEPVNFEAATALSTLFLLILVGLSLFYQYKIVKRQASTMTGRGFSGRISSLGKMRYWISGLLLFYIAFSNILPVVFLVLGSFMRMFGFFEISRPFTLDNWKTVLTDSALLSSLKNTLIIGFSAAFASIAFGLIIAYVLARGKFPFRGTISLLSWLPYGIPGILLGIGLIGMFLKVPVLSMLYGTLAALILARWVSHVPLDVQMFRSTIQQIPLELEESAIVHGASWFATMRYVFFPITLPMSISVGLIAFIGAIRDIGTMVLLSNSQTRPLSIMMLEYSVGGELESGSVIAVMTVIIVLIVAFLIRRLGLHTHKNM